MAKKEKARFDYNAELRQLKELGPERLYLLCGEEDYLREAYLEELKKMCLAGGEADFNYKRLNGASLELGELSQAVDAVPFFAEHTLVEVRDYDVNRCREGELERLKAILGDLPAYCTLVFVFASNYELDGRLSSVRTMKKLGRCIEFTAQGQAALVGWIGKRFAAQGKSISRQDAEYLIFNAGSLMNHLIPEIEKLAAGVRGETVTARDIDELVQRLPEADAFTMTDLLGLGKFDDAARLLGELLAKREEPIKILALVGMQMRRVFAVKLAMRENRSRSEMMELCGVKFDFILQKLQQSARQYTLAQLKEILELCAEYDYKMKSSGQDGTELLKEHFSRMAACVKC